MKAFKCCLGQAEENVAYWPIPSNDVAYEFLDGFLLWTCADKPGRQKAFRQCGCEYALPVGTGNRTFYCNKDST